jgi:sorbitol/mannitol transport system permease protein
MSSGERWRRRGPLLPALVFTIVVTQIPFLLTIAISTLNWNVLQPGTKNFLGFGKFSSFAGLSNYGTVFTDTRLRNAVINTVVLTASVVIISSLLGLALAVLLDKKFPGRGLARTLLIAPFLVMPVASALLWKHALYNPDYGLLNGGLDWLWQLFGAETGPSKDWISSFPMPAVVVALVWQWTPFMMLILLAGLQAQAGDVLEAAKIDRAGGFQTFRFITLPHLRQYIELSALLGSIYVVQNFDHVFVITSGGLGTANLPYTIYQTFYQAHDYGLASAAGVIVVIGSIIIATFALRVVSSLFREA